MKTIIELITDELKSVFTECGYDESYARVTVSNRPDLCEFQCNGAMAAAKAYKKAPFMIADDIVNIGLHFFHKDVRLYAASCSEV